MGRFMLALLDVRLSDPDIELDFLRPGPMGPEGAWPDIRFTGGMGCQKDVSLGLGGLRIETLSLDAVVGQMKGEGHSRENLQYLAAVCTMDGIGRIGTNSQARGKRREKT